MLFNVPDRFIWLDKDLDNYVVFSGLYVCFLVFRDLIGVPVTISVVVITVALLRYLFPDRRHLVLGMLQLWISIFFREIEHRGEQHVPKKGAVVLVCAPHANQFIDPLVIMKTCGRDDLGFLIAAKSYRKRVIGDFAKAIGSIPVERAQDLATSAPGMITSAGTVVKGMGTTFDKISPGSSILCNQETILIEKIINETELLLKKPFTDAIEKPKPYKLIPKVNQTDMFAAVYEHLLQGKTFGIFPEGGSHDRPDLLPLKAGVAIMSIGAVYANPGLDITIIPVGLNYFSGHKFRSRVYADYGKPIYVKSEHVPAFAKGGETKRAACDSLMEQIEEGLRAVTVSAPDYETLHTIWAVRRLYLPSHRRSDTATTLKVTQRFLEAYKLVQHNPKVIGLKEEVMQYRANLEEYGVRDHMVANLPEQSFRAVRLLIRRYILLLALSAVAVPGAIVLLPVAVAALIISEQKRKEALAGSVVKLEAKDVLGTWKLLVGFILAPMVVLLYAVLIAIYFHSLDYALAFVLVMGPCLHATIVAYEKIPALMRSVKTLRQVIIRRNDGEELRELRRHLKNDIRALVDDDELGVRDKVYPGFNQDRELEMRRLYSYTAQ